jgi:hypothetical protein
VAIVALAAGAGYGIYRLIRGGAAGPPPCTPGTKTCDGYNLYTCNAEGNWELTETNSPQCGYVEDIWFKDREELARKSFVLNIIGGGWEKDNEALGSEEFIIKVIDSGWRPDTVELAREALTVEIISSAWKPDNVELAREGIAVKIT